MVAFARIFGCPGTFLTFLFYKDNKYETPPPYGRSGVIALGEENLMQGTPVFLIAGWLLTDERVQDKPTYIGEFSNLQRGDRAVSPHGKARYRLTLRYDGPPQIVSADFPDISCLQTYVRYDMIDVT